MLIESVHRSLHNQLLHEAPAERFAEQRVNLLKTQVVQLERQVKVLNKREGNVIQQLYSGNATDSSP